MLFPLICEILAVIFTSSQGHIKPKTLLSFFRREWVNTSVFSANPNQMNPYFPRARSIYCFLLHITELLSCLIYSEFSSLEKKNSMPHTNRIKH